MSRIRTQLVWLMILLHSGPVAGQTAQNAAAQPPLVGVNAPASVGRFARWLDLQTGTLGARYKDAKTSNQPWLYQVQYQFLTRGRFKFDRRGRYYAGFRLSTGKIFSYSWNSTGVGEGSPATNIYLKELFLSIAPRKMFEIQWGGIGISRGESTEITSYSNNGYLMGERITVRRPDKLFFDEISATGAYIGDQTKPGVFQRIERLGSMNYHQFLVLKRIREWFSFSADYTFRDGIETLRQAVKLNALKNRYIDSVVVENYQRLDFHPSWGYAVTAQKNPIRRLALTGGVVDIDEYFSDWNADKLGRGKRIFVVASYNFWREFSASVFAGKAFANNFPVINAARYDLVITYDFLKALKKHAVL